MSKRNLILAVLALIVVGALMYREFPRAGMVVTALAGLFYLAAGAKRTVRYLRNFRRIGARQRVQAIAAVGIAAVVLSMWFSRSVAYFMLLVLLAVDYLATENPATQNQHEK